jgi:putative tryptophan/tyrosine transport system substrate-binding protein
MKKNDLIERGRALFALMRPFCRRSVRTKPRGLLLGLVFALFATGAGAKPYRVGIVLPGDEWASSVDGVKEGLKAQGYIEGKDIVYFLENAKGDKKVVSEATKKFVADKVDAVYTITNTALKIVVEVTRPSKTPVVFGSASGPVESGIIEGYTTPDTHVTGVTSGSIELVAKRLEILKDVLPYIKKVAVIGDIDSDSSKAAFAIAEETAAKLRLALIEIRVMSKEEAIERAKRVTRKEADAIFLVPGLHGVGALTEIAAQAKSARIPLAVYQVEHVKKNGALLSYGSSYYLQGKQSASLLDKVLKGIQPSKLPIERPKLHELILNLDTASEAGIKFSPEVLNRADELVGGTAKR